MQAAQLREDDSRRLYESFYTYFDMSKSFAILLEFEKNGNLPSTRFPLLGEGSFCRAFKLASQGGESRRGAAFSFALCISHLSFQEEKSAFTLQSWQKRMLYLKGFARRLPLLPPFEFLKGQTRLAWVTPLGEEDQRLLSPHWQPLDRHIAYLQKTLGEHQLVINDSIQIRLWQGIPFVCDLSDLQTLQLAP